MYLELEMNKIKLLRFLRIREFIRIASESCRIQGLQYMQFSIIDC